MSFGNDFNVSTGPPFRITSISIPTAIPNLVSVVRNAVSIRQGQGDVYVGVSGPNLPNGASLTITGDGLTVGASTFENRSPGINSLIVKVNVSSGATPGLRSFVVTHGANVAYANGYLEIAAAVPDYNFDLLDDRFQRAFWSPWTIGDSAPTADPDQDGFSNAFEHRTGTIPTDPGSNRLAISRVMRQGDSIAISWEADRGKRYQLYSRGSLNAGTWEPIGRALSATATEMTQTDPTTNQTRFYRLELQR